MADTPGKPFPVISDRTKLSFSVGTLLTVMASAIGGAVWLTTLANNVSEMKAQISHIERDVEQIKNHIYNQQKVSINP